MSRSVTPRLGTGLARATAPIDEVAAQLQKVVAQAAEAHRSFVEKRGELPASRPLAPEDDLYAAYVADRVLGPLVGVLRRSDIGQALDDAWMEMQSALSTAVRNPGAALPDLTREVAEAVVGHHVTVRIPEALKPAMVERTKVLGEWAHRVEQGARGWWAELLDEVERDDEAEAEADVDPVGRAMVLLQEALDSVASDAWVPLTEAAAGVLEDCSADFDADVEAATTGELKLKKRPVAVAPTPWAEVAKRQGRWVGWHREVASRLALEVTMVRVRNGLYGLAAREIDTNHKRATKIATELEDIHGRLRDLAQELQLRCEEVGGLLEEEELRGWSDRSLEVVEGPWAAELEELAASRVGLPGAGERMAEAAYRLVASQPDTFVVHRVPEGDVPDPDDDPITFDFRRVVSQCVDALLIERLEATPAPAVEALEHLRFNAAELPEVVRSVFDTAITEVQTDDGPEDDDAALIRMIPDALRRASTLALRVSEDVVDEFDPWEESARAVIDQGWLRLSERAVLSSGVGEQLADLREGAAQAVRENLRDAGEFIASLGRSTVSVGGRGWRKALEVFRWLGAPDGEAALAPESPVKDFFARADELGQDFPLVYRRLFSGEPLSDASLMVGREAHLERISAAWTGDHSRPLLVLGDPGAGRTSLLRAAVHAGGDACTLIELSDRVEEMDSLLTVFHRADFEDDGYGLAGVASQAAKRHRGRSLILVDGLEHTFLRRTGGADLVKAVLGEAVDTAKHVGWVFGMSSVAWQVITKLSPHVAAGIDVLTVQPLDRESVEAAIVRRHQRSGIPLVFAAPESPGTILQRRLRRARNHEARQELLRSEYFDRLHRASGGTMRLALALWLDSLVLDESEGTAVVNFPRQMPEGFMDALGLEEVFALKSFLEHGSLDGSELRTVLRVTHGDADRIIERLLDFGVLTPTRKNGSDGGFTSGWVERFELRGAALGPVVRYLQRRNILHP